MRACDNNDLLSIRRTLEIPILIGAISNIFVATLIVGGILIFTIGTFASILEMTGIGDVLPFLGGFTILGCLLFLMIKQISRELHFYVNWKGMDDDEFYDMASSITTHEIFLGFFLNMIAFICGIIGKIFLAKVRANEKLFVSRLRAFPKREESPYDVPHSPSVSSYPSRSSSSPYAFKPLVPPSLPIKPQDRR